MQAMKGWVKIYRELQEWEWYTKPEMVHLYIHLLLSANHTTVKWQGVTVKRGQLVTSISQLSKNTGLSVQSVRTCLARLKSTSEITIEATKAYTLITICNYGRYIEKDSESNKASNKASNKQPTKQKQSANKALTTNKNDKNEIYIHTQYNYLVNTLAQARANTRECVQQMGEMAKELATRIRLGDEEAVNGYAKFTICDKGFLWIWSNHHELLSLFDNSCTYQDFAELHNKYEVDDIKRVVAAMANKLPQSGTRLGSFITTFHQWASTDYKIAEKRRLGNPMYN